MKLRIAIFSIHNHFKDGTFISCKLLYKTLLYLKLKIRINLIFRTLLNFKFIFSISLMSLFEFKYAKKFKILFQIDEIKFNKFLKRSQF